MTVILPASGALNWDTILNTAIESLDVRLTAAESKFVAAPANATATGVAGQIAKDSNYLYVCVATNTWKRVAISTW